MKIAAWYLGKPTGIFEPTSDGYTIYDTDLHPMTSGEEHDALLQMLTSNLAYLQLTDRATTPEEACEHLLNSGTGYWELQKLP